MPLCDVNMVNKVLSDIEMEKLDDSLLAFANSSADIYSFSFDHLADPIWPGMGTAAADAVLSGNGRQLFDGESLVGSGFIGGGGNDRSNHNSSNNNMNLGQLMNDSHGGYSLGGNSSSNSNPNGQSSLLADTAHGSLASLVAQGNPSKALKRPRPPKSVANHLWTLIFFKLF